MDVNKINIKITIVSTIAVIFISALVFFFPNQVKEYADLIFNWMLFNLDVLFLVGTLTSLIFLMYLMLSKYGNIKLGADKPEFSKLKIFNMLFCASFGASALYWCFTEVMYYYTAPPMGIEPYTTKAAEYGLAYNLFHWGPSAWALYAICAIPIIYSFYIRGHKQFQLSAVCNVVYEGKVPGIVTKSIDGLFIFSCFGVCSISLGLSVPLIAECIATVMGITPSLWLNVGIIIVISMVFTLSSYVGLGKGMSKVSDLNVMFFILFLGGMLILSGLVATFEYMSTAIGIMIKEYAVMSLGTDSFDKGGFPQYWTVFYWSYWLTFGPGMGVFIARISKGHKLKEVIGMVLVAGPIGCFIMHSILQHYTMKLQLSGAIDAAGMVEAGQGNQLIVQVLQSTPIPTLALIAFAVIAILFMATTLDSNSFTLASVATKKLGKGDDPSPAFRLYWCLLLSVLPLILSIINTDLNTLKTIAIIVATPLGLLIIVLNIQTYKVMSKQFSNMNAKEIGEYKCPQPTEECDAVAQASEQ